MDIPAISISMNRAKVANQVQMSVLKMAMDSVKGEGADIAKLLESAKAVEMQVQPHIGGNVDIRG